MSVTVTPLALAAAMLVLVIGASQASTRPHIIVIVADDLVRGRVVAEDPQREAGDL